MSIWTPLPSFSLPSPSSAMRIHRDAPPFLLPSFSRPSPFLLPSFSLPSPFLLARSLPRFLARALSLSLSRSLARSLAYKLGQFSLILRASFFQLFSALLAFRMHSSLRSPFPFFSPAVPSSLTAHLASCAIVWAGTSAQCASDDAGEIRVENARGKARWKARTTAQRTAPTNAGVKRKKRGEKRARRSSTDARAGLGERFRMWPLMWPRINVAAKSMWPRPDELCPHSRLCALRPPCLLAWPASPFPLLTPSLNPSLLIPLS